MSWFEDCVSLNEDCHLVQLAAMYKGQLFNSYILPKKNISRAATSITGFALRKGKLYRDGQELEAIP